MEMITSKQNPKIRHICNLYDRRYREIEGSFVVEGYRACERLLQSDYSIEALYYCSEFWTQSHKESFEGLIQSCLILLVNIFPSALKDKELKFKPF